MCDAGWTDCDNDPANGCEADLATDSNNCGQCGVHCPMGEPCTLGACPLLDCKGYANCPGDPPDTCPTMLGTNINCNFCGDTCALANADAQCTPMGNAWACNLVQCNPGYANCDAMAANGCEVNTSTDANNCASCGNACPFGPSSTAVCNAGACGLECSPGFSDCDGQAADGCEVFTQIDPNNCGACGVVCSLPNATPDCTAGICTIAMCDTGFADCNQNAADGCEVNVLDNPQSCGSCGLVCLPNATCLMGVCYPGCSPPFINCGGFGCNINSYTDVNNCGGCNIVCNLPNATPVCGQGSCEIASCNASYRDCNAIASDGCEVNTLTDPKHCGSCGVACAVGHVCSGGMCQ
jgi:hypothetical protein